MQTIAEALAEEERKKTLQLAAELREEKKKELAIHKEHQKEVALLRKEAKEAKANEEKITFIVKQLLQKKMSIEFIRETTGLTRKRIDEIKKKIG